MNWDEKYYSSDLIPTITSPHQIYRAGTSQANISRKNALNALDSPKRMSIYSAHALPTQSSLNIEYGNLVQRSSLVVDPVFSISRHLATKQQPINYNSENFNTANAAAMHRPYASMHSMTNVHLSTKLQTKKEDIQKASTQKLMTIRHV